MSADAWDERYRQAPGMWGREPSPALAPILDRLADRTGSVVDLAGGDGRHAAWLARHGWSATVVDFSAVALDQARRQAEAAGLSVDVACADVEQWAPPGPVDAVVVAYLQLPGDRLRGVLTRAAGWLRPGGLLAYVGHARENLARGRGGPQDEAVLPTVAQLAAAAEGLQVHDLCHVLRPAEGERAAIDVRLVAGPWGSEQQPNG